MHLDYAHPEADRWLRNEPELDPFIVEALTAEASRPRCESTEDGLLVELRGVNKNPGADPEDLVSIRLFCSESRVISTRHRRLLTATEMAAALRSGNGPRGSGDLISMLAGRLIERMGGVIHELDDRIDDLEEHIIEGAGQETRGGLLDLRREIIRLRRYLSPQREAIDQLQVVNAGGLGKRDRLRIREADDRLKRYIEDLDSARDRAGIAYEELSSRLAEQMNNRMYMLSIIAGVFLPLGFLTGLLGINVGGIPLADEPLGFLMVALFLLAVVLLQLLIFRRMRWL